MLEGHFFNPAVLASVPTLIQIFGTALFCVVFLFLWRQSGVTYFGFWSMAWAVECIALVSSAVGDSSGSIVFVWIREFLEFLFTLSLVTAAQSAVTSTASGYRSKLRSLMRVSAVLLVAYAFAWRLPVAVFGGFHASILMLVYWYSLVRIGDGRYLGNGFGGKLMSFTLACLFLQYMGYVLVYLYIGFGGQAVWPRWLLWHGVYDLIPQTLLAFSAMTMWIQTQQEVIGQLRTELDSVAKLAAGSAELDHLTGLRNRGALEHLLDEPFTGVVAVCDLDYFKDINDHFGHLVGDEVLRNVGSLIRASIRSEDDAFRWGGDEFVILLRHQYLDVAHSRMAVLEERLQIFRILGYGTFPLRLSWGAAKCDHHTLRPVLEEADKQMYEHKRQAHGAKQ